MLVSTFPELPTALNQGIYLKLSEKASYDLRTTPSLKAFVSSLGCYYFSRLLEAPPLGLGRRVRKMAAAQRQSLGKARKCRGRFCIGSRASCNDMKEQINKDVYI